MSLRSGPVPVGPVPVGPVPVGLVPVGPVPVGPEPFGAAFQDNSTLKHVETFINNFRNNSKLRGSFYYMQRLPFPKRGFTSIKSYDFFFAVAVAWIH